jgi:hypothetical protein
MINDEGIRRIGMGGVDLKRKANAWLAQLQDKGPLTQKVASVEAENDQLRMQVETLAKQVSQLMTATQAPASVGPTVLTASDLIDEEEPVKRGPGRPRKEG